jgi:hypothetical protein
MIGKYAGLLGLLFLAGCQMVDTSTPVPQPDTVIFGRVAEIRAVANEPGVSEVDIRAGLPQAMQAAMHRENRSVPALEKDLLVRARVNADTLCVADMLPVDLDEFRVGQEVAVVPRPGTCAMVGTKLFLAEAAELYQFAAYQLRVLPRSLPVLPPEIATPADPARINSAGTERTPLALDGGRVVYFAAGLLPALGKSDAPRGARRPGMLAAGGQPAPWAARGAYRPYRVEFRGGHWAAPTPVELPGIAADASARVTWVNQGETACLLEVDGSDGSRGLFSSARASAAAPWEAGTQVKVEGGGNVGDAQRFGSQGGALVWTVYEAAGSDLWLSLQGQKPGPVDPRINTLGPEWSPRVGPRNILYFCRGDRQLRFAGGTVEEVRLPGKQRRPLLEAAPSADGSLLFFRVPRYVPGEPDWDLAVAPAAGHGQWGAPVPLDDWKPAER